MYSTYLMPEVEKGGGKNLPAHLNHFFGSVKRGKTWDKIQAFAEAVMLRMENCPVLSKFGLTHSIQKRRQYMGRIVLRVFVTFFVLMCFLTTGLVFSIQAQDQKGDVVYATNYGSFYTKGGDPATHRAGEGALIATTVFEGLVDMGKNLETLPSVAESWKVAPDWTYVDFFLKKGVKFHNGDPVTAEDVKFSFAKHMDPKFRMALGIDYRKRIKEIEVISPLQARFHLHMPAPGIWKRFWWDGAIMPKKYREAVGEDEFAAKPVGSGPFRWLEYKQDQYWKIEALPKHHRQAPGFKTMTIMYVPDHSTRLSMLRAGEADIAVLAGPHIPVVKSDPNLNYVQVNHTVGISLTYCDMANPERKSPLQDIRVRKAISMAIDRATICEKILYGGASPWGEVLCPYNLGYDPNVKPDPYDPEKAKALLAEAGYANGFETAINTMARDKITNEALAANLADVGIKAKVNVYEAGAFYDACRGKKLIGMKQGTLWYDAEPHPGADIQNSFNKGAVWAYYTDDEVENLIDESMGATTDEEVVQYGRKMSKMIRDKYFRVPLWSRHANYGTTKRIVKWEPQAGSYPGTRFEYMIVNP
jgi:peptide/nickel transport system substrate-binding protein